MSKRRRVVVTGVGLVSPLGVGTEATWSALTAGQSGIGPITQFDPADYDCRIAGEVSDFDPKDFLDVKQVRRTDRFIQFGLAAAHFAMENSGLPVDDVGAHRVGVLVGSGIGGIATIEATARTLIERGPSRISPFFIPMLAVNMAAGHISIRYGLSGPNSAPSTACTTGLHALGDAYRLIQHGYADAVLAGGTEAVVQPLAVGGFCRMKALSTRNDEPEKASRPWDRDRDGFVIGEGAGLLVLEELEQGLVQLEERSHDRELVNGVFRAAHSIKGGAGAVGYDALVTVTHTAENVLSRVRERELEVTRPLIDLLLRAVDKVRALVDDLAAGTPGQVDSATKQLLANLGRYEGVSGGGGGDTAEPEPEPAS